MMFLDSTFRVKVCWVLIGVRRLFRVDEGLRKFIRV